MKKIKLIVAFCFMMLNIAYGQTLNWASLKVNERHIANLNWGLDYGVVLGVAYGYQIKTAFPVVVGAEFTMPSGKNAADDFKTKLGGQVRWVTVNDFGFTTKIQGVFRRFENNYVTMANFGGDVSAIIGYYKPKYFLAGEAGFDKAIVTHFKHTLLMKENFAAKDGWFVPATGGNFYYGLQSGFSWRKHEITLKIGKLVSQDFKTEPTLPFYGQLGYNLKLK